MIQDTVNVLGIPQARDIAGTLAGKILNVLVMCWVGTCMVLCPFPCNALVMYWTGTLALAPSERTLIYHVLLNRRNGLVSTLYLGGERGQYNRPIKKQPIKEQPNKLIKYYPRVGTGSQRPEPKNLRNFDLKFSKQFCFFRGGPLVHDSMGI